MYNLINLFRVKVDEEKKKLIPSLFGDEDFSLFLYTFFIAREQDFENIYLRILCTSDAIINSLVSLCFVLFCFVWR